MGKERRNRAIERRVTGENLKEGFAVETTVFRPGTEWIKNLIRQYKNPVYGAYLHGCEVIADWKVANRLNGQDIDLLDYLSQWVVVVKMAPENESSDFNDLVGLCHADSNPEWQCWLKMIANPSYFSAMPGARAMKAGGLSCFAEIAVVFHEAMHVYRKHMEECNLKRLRGFQKVLREENEASTLAMAEFIKMATVLGLSEEVVTRANRLLDANYFSYQVGYETRFGSISFPGSRKLGLLYKEREMLREATLWMMGKYSW